MSCQRELRTRHILGRDHCRDRQDTDKTQRGIDGYSQRNAPKVSNKKEELKNKERIQTYTKKKALVSPSQKLADEILMFQFTRRLH